jgi:hypothetical protein
MLTKNNKADASGIETLVHLNRNDRSKTMRKKFKGSLLISCLFSFSLFTYVLTTFKMLNGGGDRVITPLLLEPVLPYGFKLSRSFEDFTY